MNSVAEALQNPLGVVWLVMVVSVIVLLWRRQRRSAVWVAIPAGLLFLIGSTPLSEILAERMEAPYATGRGVSTEPADVVVALGGSHRAAGSGLLEFDFGEAEDRVLAAVELGRRGAAREIVLGGSSQEIPGKPGVPTMSLVRDWLVSTRLVPPDSTDLGICRNTREEALHFKEVQARKGWKTVILVTSALHMRRAEATFRKAGINVQPVACDFQVHGVEGSGRSFTLMPGQRRIALLTAYLHEQIGLLAYRWRGWI